MLLPPCDLAQDKVEGTLEVLRGEILYVLGFRLGLGYDARSLSLRGLPACSQDLLGLLMGLGQRSLAQDQRRFFGFLNQLRSLPLRFGVDPRGLLLNRQYAGNRLLTHFSHPT